MGWDQENHKRSTINSVTIQLFIPLVFFFIFPSPEIQCNSGMNVVQWNAGLNPISINSYNFSIKNENTVAQHEKERTNQDLKSKNKQRFKKSAPKVLDDTATVYITKTGKKFHRSSCPTLRKTKTPIIKKEAISKQYTPCGKCKP
jgi:hypothetical protein